MTRLMQEVFEKILQLSEEQQEILGIYLQKYLIELLEKSEREKRIAEQKYMIDEDINCLPKRRIPPVFLEGKGKTLGDLVSPIIDEEDWECLK